MSELILGTLSLLLGYMIIRFAIALLRSDHAIAWSLMGVVFSAALLLVVGFARTVQVFAINASAAKSMCHAVGNGRLPSIVSTWAKIGSFSGPTGRRLLTRSSSE